MKVSLLIVSKNRKSELKKTLLVLEKIIDFSIHEVLILLDGCTDDSVFLKTEFDWANWTVLNKSIGASPARNILYKKAKGQILIGLDDDAHPLSTDFIKVTEALFKEFSDVGILAFQEIKGIFSSDEEALTYKKEALEEYFCTEFVGCGFAIRKEVYEATNGFPVWIDIYGEESCVAIEVLARDYAILYTNRIVVNHRINKAVRMQMGRNYFRFGKQLKNTAFYYFVYYPFPLFKIVNLFWHNFKKYGRSDWMYFKICFQSIFKVLFFLPRLMRYRNPIETRILKKIRSLPNPKY